MEEEHPLLKQAQRKGWEIYQRDRRWVGGGKMRSFAAGQQVTHMFAGWEFLGLNDGICLFVATEISLAEEDFFSPIPGPFHNQTPALLTVHCSSTLSLFFLKTSALKWYNCMRIPALVFSKGPVLKKVCDQPRLVKKEALKP